MTNNNINDFRNLPSMDMTSKENIESAAKADAPSGGVSGKYVVTVAQASLSQSKNGSVFITLAFQMPNGKVYRQDAKHIRAANGDEGFYASKLRTLFGVTGARDTLGTTRIKDGEFVDGQFVEREIEVPSYVDLLGKQVGVVLNFYQKYPDSYGMNGYTGYPIPSRQSDPAGYENAKSQATTIWMPNYEKEVQPVFDFVLFYSPETEKSFAEMLDDNIEEPKAVQETLDKIMSKDHKAVQLSDKAWDDLRIRLLKKNLKKAGMSFDHNLFEASFEANPEQIQDSDLI
ncbi:MAG: hypothetical protein RBT65_15525 [Methanolobus sp.]|nr:hypothetical protein [Methanolobus sp.]